MASKINCGSYCQLHLIKTKVFGIRLVMKISLLNLLIILLYKCLNARVEGGSLFGNGILPPKVKYFLWLLLLDKLLTKNQCFKRGLVVHPSCYKCWESASLLRK